MSNYPAIPTLNWRQRWRNLLWVVPLLIVWGCVLAAVPDLLHWVRGRPSSFAPVFIIVLWAYLIYAYAVTILGVEIDDETVSVAIWARTKRIPRQSIAKIEAVRSRGKLKKIVLFDSSKRTIGIIPIIRGSRRIDRAEELLAELENIVGPNEVTSI